MLQSGDFRFPVEKAAKLLSALSNEMRLRTLIRLSLGKLTAAMIASGEDLHVSSIHVHMAILVRAELVKRVRKKHTIVFSITERGRILLNALPRS